MAPLPIDNNGNKVIGGLSSADGVTVVPWYVDPTTHALEIDDNTTGSDLSGDIAKRDANNQPNAMGVSSSDGSTPTAPYVDPVGKMLLINSN